METKLDVHAMLAPVFHRTVDCGKFRIVYRIPISVLYPMAVVKRHSGEVESKMPNKAEVVFTKFVLVLVDTRDYVEATPTFDRTPRGPRHIGTDCDNGR